MYVSESCDRTNAPYMHVQPSRAIRNLEHLQLKENSVLTAMVGLNDAKKLIKTLTPGEQVDLAGLRKECVKMRVVVEFKDALVGLCGAFLKRSQAHLCQVAKAGDLFVTSPNIVSLSSISLFLFCCTCTAVLNRDTVLTLNWLCLFGMCGITVL